MRHKDESGESDGSVRRRGVAWAARTVRLELGLGMAFCCVLCCVFALTAGAACAELAPAYAAGSPRRSYPQHAPGYLGILFENLNGNQMTALHLKSGGGVAIVMVDHDGPAGKAGLRAHDVIVSLNGQPIDSAETLRRMIHDAGVGAEIALVVVRDGQQVTVNATLASRGDVEREAAARMAAGDPPAVESDPPDDSPGESYDAAQTPPTISARGSAFLAEILHSTPFTGLMLETMAPQLAGFFGAPSGIGLLVETVVPNSPAAAAGLRAGDVVLRVDSIDVRSTSEWTRRLQASRGRAIALTVLRDRHEQTITLIPLLKRRSRVEWPEEFGGSGTATCLFA